MMARGTEERIGLNQTACLITGIPAAASNPKKSEIISTGSALNSIR